MMMGGFGDIPLHKNSQNVSTSLASDDIDNSDIISLVEETFEKLDDLQQEEDVQTRYDNSARTHSLADSPSASTSTSMNSMSNVRDQEVDKYLSKLTIDTLRNFHDDDIDSRVNTNMQSMLDDDDMSCEIQNLSSVENLLREELTGLDGMLCAYDVAGDYDEGNNKSNICGAEGGSSEESWNVVRSLADDMEDEQDQHQQQMNMGDKRDNPPPPSTPEHIKSNIGWQGEELAERATSIGLKRRSCDLGEYTCPIAQIPGLQHYDLTENDDSCRGSGYNDCHREYLRSMTGKGLRRIYIGLAPPPSHQDDAGSSTSPEKNTALTPEQHAGIDHVNEPVSIRTISIQIRPDVLCGAVMDALATAVQLECQGEISKRQGGHLFAHLPPHYRFRSSHQAAESKESGKSPFSALYRKNSNGAHDNNVISLPAVDLDAQICTKKAGTKYERVLLLRFYVSNDANDIRGAIELDAADNLSRECYQSDTIWDAAKVLSSIENEWSMNGASYTHADDDYEKGATLSSAFRSESLTSRFGKMVLSPVAYIAGRGSESDISMSAIKSARKAHPRVPSHAPALSKDDAQYVDATWKCIIKCIIELDSRDLTFLSLANVAFATFPALTTLDAHFCSQLRLFCRENMVVSLLKSASELEEYARAEEHACAVLIYLLRWAYTAYEMNPPVFPHMIPLSAYPLDYRPPEVDCPPWGRKVTEILNLIIANKHTNFVKDTSSPNMVGSNFELCNVSVKSVVDAFQCQMDEEQVARLQRKNVQVMDRLAKVQAHKRQSTLILRDSYGVKFLSTKAADTLYEKIMQSQSTLSFHSHATHVSGMHGEEMEIPHLNQQNMVPLLSCSILISGTTPGTLYLTAHHVIIFTQYIPLLSTIRGGARCHIFMLAEVELEENQSNIGFPKSLLLRLQSNLDNEKGVSEFSFLPSVGSKRFQVFLYTIKAVSSEHPDTLKFSSKGGLLYMYEDQENDSSVDRNNINRRKNALHDASGEGHDDDSYSHFNFQSSRSEIDDNIDPMSLLND